MKRPIFRVKDISAWRWRFGSCRHLSLHAKGLGRALDRAGANGHWSWPRSTLVKKVMA